MLGDKTALAVEQTELGAAAKRADHRARRMRHVGVERRAEERQPAGHRRLHVRAEPQCPPCHLGYAGKAAVELDGVERAAVAADEIHHRFQHRILGVALEKLIADQIVARLFRRCAAPDVNQPILGDISGARLGEAGHQERGAHIDGRIGHLEFCIRPRDQAVVRRWRCDLLRRETVLQPGIGILRGDFRISRP